MYADDTIVAIATPMGSGGIGVVRVSGSLSIAIADALFSRFNPSPSWKSHVLYHGQIRTRAGEAIDEGLVVFMRGPHSYTGEDVVEFHCHGGTCLLQQVLAAVLASGARQAQAGEFTKRAFLNGRLDLAQAEAVADAISARTTLAVSLAVEQLAGSVSAVVQKLRDRIIELKAYLEAQIDFSEEDFVIDRRELLERSEECRETIEGLLQTYRYGKLIRNGVRVVIVGRPNVGKSSLLNALLGEDRSIVTPIAGTTRDIVEESIDLGGIPLVVLDTAGLRSVHSADPVEKIGIERALRSLSSADLALVVLDGSQSLAPEDLDVLQATAQIKRLVILNKVDLGARISSRDLEPDSVVPISAKHLQGIDKLRIALTTVLTTARPTFDSPIISRARHVVSLEQASKSLELCSHSLRHAQPPDVVAVDVQDALDHLGEITGAVTNEDVLDKIFKDFCVGK